MYVCEAISPGKPAFGEQLSVGRQKPRSLAMQGSIDAFFDEIKFENKRTQEAGADLS
jgi:hypothetical protein